MLAPVLTIVVSVGLGCLLALAPGGNRLFGGVIRTFAVAAALGVVVLHLVPHALHRVGLAGLAVAVAAYLATPLIERGVAQAVQSRGAGAPDLHMEAAFAALLVHRVGDGAAMAVGQRHGVALLLALGAHSVPVVTFVVMAFAGTRGLRHGLWRAAAMALASGVGVVAIEAIPGLTMGTTGGYVDAVVAGTLLHVVAHELRTDPPVGIGTKVMDFVAALAGLGACLLPELLLDSGPAHVAHAHGDVGTSELAWTALGLGLEMAPFLLVGLLLAALLQTISRFAPDVTRRTGLFASALRGSVLSAPVPLCSCSVVSISRSLGAGGAAPGLVAAFLVATPELGLETLLVTGRLLGWPLAAARLGGALVMAIGAGLIVGAFARGGNEGAEPASIEKLAHLAPQGSFVGRYARALDELVVHVGGWLAVGIALAAYLARLLPAGAFAGLQTPLSQLLALTAVALPAFVCAPAATPVAAVLVTQGLDPGAVLAGVLLGSTLNYVGVRLLRRMYGWGAALGAVVVVVVLAWGLALSVTASSLPVAEAILPEHVEQVGAHPLAWVALGALVLLGLRTSWQVGIRAWIANVFEPRHEGHAHVHVHAHCAESEDAHRHDWEQWHAHESHEPLHHDDGPR